MSDSFLIKIFVTSKGAPFLAITSSRPNRGNKLMLTLTLTLGFILNIKMIASLLGKISYIESSSVVYLHWYPKTV